MNDEPATFAHDAALHSARRNDVSLQGALKDAFGEGAAIGLLTAAQHFGWLRHGVGGLEGPDPKTKERLVATAYEARFFDSDCEVRWRKQTNGTGLGTAIMLAEQEARVPADWTRLDTLRHLAVLESRYLIWGIDSGDGVDGWTRLHRVPSGTTWLPAVPDGKSESFQLYTSEYFGSAGGDAYGNVAALEERWTFLVPAEQGEGA